MNIWIIDQYASEPKFGGISRQYDFAIELSKRGYKITVISTSFSHFTHSYFYKDKLKINQISENGRFVYLKTMKYEKNNSIKRILNTFDFVNKVIKNKVILSKEIGIPDIVVGCSIHPFTWIATRKISKKFKSKFFVEVRDLWPEHQIVDKGISRFNPAIQLLSLLEKWAYKNADKIIYSMSKGDEYICNVLGIPKDKVIWIGQPMDCKRFTNNTNRYDELPNNLKEFIGDSYICTFSGYYMIYEGVMEMLEAAKIIKDENLPIKFVFVGSGAAKKQMQTFINENNLDNVYLGERINKELIPALLYRTQICLAHLAIKDNPESFKYDASKNKINEYMFSNSCIIYGTYVKNQFVSTSGAGYTIEPFSGLAFANKIKDVYKMSDFEQKQFGINAKKYILSNNTVQVLSDKYEKIIND